jgi:hypothetical protein
MTKIVFVLYVDPIGGYPKSHRGNLLKIDLYPGAQKVPAPGSGTVASGEFAFSPNPDLVLP